MNLLLTVVAWVIIAVIVAVNVVTLFDIRAVRNNQIPRTTALGPDYLDVIYVNTPFIAVAFVFSVIWLIFG